MTRPTPMTQVALASALLAACTDSGAGSDAEPAECQIQAESEKSPGYPFDLEVYGSEVLPVLTENCSAAGCHAPPEGNGGFNVWAAASPGNCEFAQTFNSLKGFIDLANPANSAVLSSVNGSNPVHPVRYDDGDQRLAALQGYIEDASARWITDGGGGDQPPPGASPFDYAVFQETIQPILDTADNKGCALSGCHLTAAGTFKLSSAPAPGSEEIKQNFLEVTRRTNLDSPSQSLFYLQATTRHGGGASAVVSADQAQAILDWIEAASENAGDGAPTGCAPADLFDVNVFRDEIMPMLSGAVDFNNPGGTGSTGCTRGPCHGTDRGPGALFLDALGDPASNLQQFACYVNLTNPSASNILLCPLNDPRCPRYPHPGQDVFAGADDLNYQRLLAYLYGSRVDATPLDFAFFVRRINPIFNDQLAVENGAQGRTCADTAGCHGVNVAGAPPPNGSNFAIIPNADDLGRLTFNLASASSFVNFLDPDESSLFLYPTNEIANLADHPFATGLPHPGGEDFAPDSRFALDILRWAGGLRPNARGFITDWLVAGDYPATLVSDTTPIDEAGSTPRIFDPTGATQFNDGQWDGLFSEIDAVDLNSAFPRAATSGRLAYAVAYILNTSSTDITAQLAVSSPNSVRIYVGQNLVAQSDGGAATAIAELPAYASSQSSTRILVKVLQRAQDDDFEFSMQLRDEQGNPLTDETGELVIKLGPEGGI